MQTQEKEKGKKHSCSSLLTYFRQSRIPCLEKRVLPHIKIVLPQSRLAEGIHRPVQYHWSKVKDTTGHPGSLHLRLAEDTGLVHATMMSKYTVEK